jgi:hypothetical protein
LPTETEGRNAVIADEWGKEGEGDEGQTEVFGDAASHVCLVDEQGIQVGSASGVRAIAQDHASGVFDALDGESEGGEAAELPETLIQALQGAGWIVLGADKSEFDPGGANTGLGVGDAEDDDFVAATFELSCERGEGVDVTGAGETECS